MASLSGLSDQDLRKKLKAYGITSPVTDSTRNILLKKLNHILASEKNVSSASKAGKQKQKEASPASRPSPSNSRSGSRARTLLNLSNNDRGKEKFRSRSFLNSFSSDEDDIDDEEAPVRETRTRRSLRNSINEVSQHNISSPGPSLDMNDDNSSISQSSSYLKKAIPIVRKKSSYTSSTLSSYMWPKRSSFDLHSKDDKDYQYDTGSDSDVGIDDSDNGNQNNSYLGQIGHRSNFGTDCYRPKGSNFDFNSRVSSSFRTDIPAKNDLKDDCTITSPDDIVSQESTITSSLMANGQSSFDNVRKISSDVVSWDSSYFWLPSVPLVLLVLLTLFFCFLGFCYISIHTPLLPSFLSTLDLSQWKLKLFGHPQQIDMKVHVSEDSKYYTEDSVPSIIGFDDKFPICEEADIKLSCLSLEEAKNVPELIPLIEATILPALSLHASQYMCREAIHPYLETEPLVLLLKNEINEKSTDNLFEGLRGLGKLAGIHPYLGMEPVWKETPTNTANQKLLGLAATKQPTEILCHITAALSSLAYFMVAILIGSCAVWLLYHIFRYYRRQSEEIEQKSFELVEQILDVLENRCGTDGKDFIAVNHVRDFLVPPRERKAKTEVWNKAVAFIDNHDSRVYREIRSVGGEDSDVWRWVSGAPRSPISCPPKGPLVSDDTQPPEKVWQGQAFESLEGTQNLPPVSPTSCLKIRNMFDSELEYGENWPRRIQDSLLEKCEGIKIVHVAVDKVSKEGCVYLKCVSPQEAGKAYRSLHGWWFDGNLVTVKYLRDERYHERFPTARSASTPLTPSNNQRLSLQQGAVLSSTMASSSASSTTAQLTPKINEQQTRYLSRRKTDRSPSRNNKMYKS